MTLFVTAAMLMATRAWGADAPLPYGHEIFKLYEAGKIEDARRALKEMVERGCAIVRDHQPSQPIEFITDLGIGVTAATLVHCFDLERKHGSLKEAWPTLRDLSESVVGALDTAIARAENEPALQANEHILKSLAFAKQQKSRVIVACIIALRDTAQIDDARALLDRHGPFLVGLGVSVENMLPSPVGAGQPPRVASEPRALTADISDLYKAGKPEDARKALRVFVERDAAFVEANEPTTALDTRGFFGFWVTASFVSLCFQAERGLAGDGGLAPDFLQIADLTETTLDLAVAKALKAMQGFSDAERRSPRLDESLDLALRSKTTLLLKHISALRDTGMSNEARAVADKHRPFLLKRGIPVEELFPEGAGAGVPPAAASTGQPQAAEPAVVSGQTAAIVRLIFDYYRALSAEDPQALDALLVKGPEWATGQDIVQALDAERRAEADFDRIGDVTFGPGSSITVAAVGEGRFRITCRRVTKAFLLKGRTVTQEESDVFEVRMVGAESKIEFGRRKVQAFAR